MSKRSALYTTKKVIANAKPTYRKKVKKTYKKQNINNNGKMLMGVMQASQKLRFSFDDTNPLTSTLVLATTVIQRQYTVNDLSLLIASQAGSAVVSYTNWTRFYQRYLAEYVSINVEFVNLGTGPVYVGVAFKPINTEAWTTWAQYRNIESNTFPNKQLLLTAQGGSNDRTVITLKCKLGDLWGINSQQLGDTAFSGQTTPQVGPTIPQYVQIFALAPSNNNVSAVVVTKVKIDLVATMYQLKLQTGA